MEGAATNHGSMNIQAVHLEENTWYSDGKEALQPDQRGQKECKLWRNRSYYH